MAVVTNSEKNFSYNNMKRIISLVKGLMEKTGEVSTRCVNLYDETNVYSEGDVAYILNANNEYSLYVAQRTTTGVFDKSKWTLIDGTEVEEWTKDDIKALVNLSDEELANIQKLIKDNEISSNYTHSSSKIYADIQTAIETAKKYTNDMFASANTVSMKQVASQSEVTETSVIYLIDNGTNFDLVILPEAGGTPIIIGDTSVNLDDYLKSADADTIYLKINDANGKYATITQIDEKVSKDSILTATSAAATNEQVYSASAMNTALDKKVSKDSILTATSATATDENLYSSSAMNTALDKKVNTTDLSKMISHIGNYVAVDSPRKTDTNELWRLYHGNDFLSFQKFIDNTIEWDYRIFDATNGFSTRVLGSGDDLNDLHQNAFVTASKDCLNLPITGNCMGISVVYAGVTDYGFQLMCGANHRQYTTQNRQMYIRHCYAGTWSDWFKIGNTGITDVAPTPITFDSVPSTLTFASNSSKYYVKNGVANVDIVVNLTACTGNTPWAKIASNLPKPVNKVQVSIISEEGTAYPLCMSVGTSGDLTIRMAGTTSTSCWFTGTITYPIAD